MLEHTGVVSRLLSPYSDGSVTVGYVWKEEMGQRCIISFEKTSIHHLANLFPFRFCTSHFHFSNLDKKLS